MDEQQGRQLDEAPAAEAAREVRPGLLAAFAYPAFRYLWLGAFLSSVGTWIQDVALSWLIHAGMGDPFYLGLRSFAQEAPLLALMVIGGAAADRIDRRLILLSSQTFQMAMAMLLGVLYYFDQLGIVAIVAIHTPGLDAQRNRRSSAGSVRQTRNHAANVNRNTNVNRHTNVSRNTNVNVNRNVNVNTRPARRGGVVVGEEGAVAVGRRGAVAVGEESFVGVGRYGGVVAGERYESYEGWKVAAGVGVGIAIGTMLARPPAAATTVVVSGSSYYYADGAYYEQVYYGGSVSYRVIAAPPGAVIVTLPAGCTTTVVGAVAYQQCGGTYYQRVSTGYRVVVF